MQDALTANEISFLQNFPLNGDEIKGYVGHGAEHIVRRYKTSSVIKYLRWKVSGSFLAEPISSTVNFAKAHLLDRGAAEIFVMNFYPKAPVPILKLYHRLMSLHTYLCSPLKNSMVLLQKI